MAVNKTLDQYRLEPVLPKCNSSWVGRVTDKTQTCDTGGDSDGRRGLLKEDNEDLHSVVIAGYVRVVDTCGLLPIQ